MYKNHVSIIAPEECVLKDEFKGLMDIITYSEYHSETRFSIYLTCTKDEFVDVVHDVNKAYLDHLQEKDEAGTKKITFEVSTYENILMFIEDGEEVWIYDRIKKGIASKWRNMRYM